MTLADLTYDELLARAAPFLDGNVQSRHKGHPDQSVHGRKGKAKKVAGFVRPPGYSAAPKINAVDAAMMQDEMLGGRPWSEEQRQALNFYTDEGYRRINAALHNPSGKPAPKIAAAIANISAAMRPLPEPTRVYRGVNRQSLGLGPDDDWGSLTNSRFQNAGFSSTSIDRNSAAGAGTDAAASGALLVIDVPDGVPAAYVDSVSAHRGEGELLLGAGMTYEFMGVDGEHNGIPVVRARVVPL